MIKKTSIFLSEKGISLIEILTAIVILSIIIISLLTVFIQSSQTNNVSKNIVDATFVAESHMEEIYQCVVESRNLDEAVLKIKDKSYTLKSKNTNAYFEKNVDKHYVLIDVEPSPNSSIVETRVKVYKDSSQNNAQAQMELVLSWKK